MFTKRIIVMTVPVFVLVAGLAATGRQSKKELTADEIMDAVDRAQEYSSAYMEARQVITTSDGQKRVLTIRSWSLDSGAEQLAEYLSPADVAGQKMLMTDNGNNIWMYNPETRRTRKIGSHMRKRKVMGSDFTYEDQAAGKMKEYYTGSLMPHEKLAGEDFYRLKLVPTKKGPGYGKLVAWISRKDFLPRRIDYYEKKSVKPFKRMILKDIKEVAWHVVEKGVKVRKTRMFPYTIIMKNLEDRTFTSNMVTRIIYGASIPRSIFRPENLGK